VKRALPCLAVLLAMLPATASAVQLGQPKKGSALSGAQLTVGEVFYYKLNLDLDDDKDDDRLPAFPLHEFVSRTTVDLKVKRFSAGAQFDIVGAAPDCSGDVPAGQADRYGPHIDCVLGEGWDDSAPRNLLLRPEKIYLRYRSPVFDLDLGDFYAAFGRGIVLALVKQPEIDIDTSLLGGRADIRTEYVDFTVLGGITNPQEVSMELKNLDIDKVDWDAIAGANIQLRPHKQVGLSVHGVGYNLQDTPSFSLGGTVGVNGIGGVVDLFAEGDAFLYRYEDMEAAIEAGEPTAGYAVYASGTTYAGPLTLLLEFKRYKNTKHPDILTRPGPVVPTQYGKPPTLEYEIAVTDDVQKSIDSEDITGWRANADLWFLMSDTTVSISFANSFDHDDHPGYSPQREASIHPMVGLRQPIHASETVSIHLEGEVGYRHDFPMRAPEGDPDQFLPNAGLLHYRADVGLTVGKHAFEIVSTYRRHHFTLQEEACWLANGETKCDRDDGYIAWENALSYTLMGKYTLALHVDFTDRIQDQLGALAGIGNLHFNEEFVSSTYIGGELILKPTSNLEVYLFWGSQKSGIVCTGGACRTVPAFTGVKSKVSITF